MVYAISMLKTGKEGQVAFSITPYRRDVFGYVVGDEIQFLNEQYAQQEQSLDGLYFVVFQVEDSEGGKKLFPKNENKFTDMLRNSIKKLNFN